jgi:thiamine kinase-like enzyme
MRDSKKCFTEIARIFHRLRIALKTPLDQAIPISFPEGSNNQFLKVEDIKGHFYLIRINGKLWPPFTRTDEDRNLRQYSSRKINSNVIYNDPTKGFQICELFDENTRLDIIFRKNQNLNLLNHVGRAIKKYHNSLNFSNEYPILLVTQNAFKNIMVATQNELKQYYQIILSMLITINADQQSFVSSHNDLLPQNIYFPKGNTTFVDGEYAARNHSSYDLAFFSLKASLTSTQESRLLIAYDPKNSADIHYSLLIMKSIVSFLLLAWDLSSQQRNNHSLLRILHVNMQMTMSHQSANCLVTERYLLSNSQENRNAQLKCVI